MARPHVTVVPYPDAGNSNLARRCSSPSYCTGAYIVHTEHNHRLVQDTCATINNHQNCGCSRVEICNLIKS
nr:unnamed protein product [Digitaria exilis]